MKTTLNELLLIDSYVAGSTAFAMRRLRSVGPEAIRVYFDSDGTPLQPASLSRPGKLLVQPDLARTLQALANDGADALYRGAIGERLVAELQANGGVLTMEDLAEVQVREFSPGLVQDYRGFTPLAKDLFAGRSRLA